MQNKLHAKIAGRWLPSNPKVTAAYFEKLRSKIKEQKKAVTAGEQSQYVHESIKKFASLIDSDPVVRMYFTQMIDQVPGYYKENPEEGFYLQSIEEMLMLIDKILDEVPAFNETDLVGFPINLILDWTMSMPAGFSVFRLSQVNAIFREILHEWSGFLSHTKPYLRAHGWMSEAAQRELKMEQYIYDPYDSENWGFTSWNDFFTRKLNPKVPSHPIGQGIVSACDSHVYAIKKNVKMRDWFWVKSQPYSLADMLADDDRKPYPNHFHDFVEPFVGGTVFQAFLSATKYHRWHSPVSGRIIRAYVKQGSYYSEAETEGMDPAGPNDSQGYITHVATRAIIFIQADDPAIGLLCMMAVGMAEVSSCVINPETNPGTNHIDIGKELGYFQYGGSTYCLVLRPGVVKQFNVKVGDEILMGQQVASVS